MSHNLSITETAAWLKARDNFLIITHRRPDGDTIGCAGALTFGLREAGKTAYILPNPEITPRYERFIVGCLAPDGYCPEYVIVVDTASYDLIPKSAKEHTNKISLGIDHHSSNSLFAENTCLDDTRAACGEVIYEILIELSGKISEKSAEALYVALSTDTGCFAYTNTTPNTLRVAAQLIEAGAPNKELNKLLFRTKTHNRVKMEGTINSNLEFHFGGSVALAFITRSMIETIGAKEDDMDDIASLPGTVEGVRAGITIRELTSPTDCKVSVRTTPLINAHKICKHFGGGGHAMAAGYSRNKPIAEIKEELLEVLKDFIPQAESTLVTSSSP